MVKHNHHGANIIGSYLAIFLLKKFCKKYRKRIKYFFLFSFVKIKSIVYSLHSKSLNLENENVNLPRLGLCVLEHYSNGVKESNNYGMFYGFNNLKNEMTLFFGVIVEN